MSSSRDTLPADSQPAFDGQYDLDGDLLSTEDHAAAMEGLSITSDAESPENLTPIPVISHINTSSEEQTSARDELEALFAEAEGGEAVTDADMAMEDTLAVLEKAYATAEKKVEDLCCQAAKLYLRCTLIEAWPEPRRSHGLKVARDALKENTVGLDQAKSAALAAENRVKTFKATKKALLPAPSHTAVPYDPALPFHAAIKRHFKITDIPTDPKTGEVHWESIGGLADKGAPTLNLTASLKKATTETLITVVVRAVHNFLELFEKYYKDKVGELFPYLAWHYMAAALVPSDLQDLYNGVVKERPVAERDWDFVNAAVEKIINIDDVRHHVKALLFQLKIEPDEPALSFVTRVRRIIRMAKAQDMGHHLSELIFNALPTNGREMVNQEFPGGISKLTDYEALLNYLARTASALSGRRTQPGVYIAQQWAPHTLLGRKRMLEDNISSSPNSGNKKMKVQTISSGSASLSPRFASAPPAYEDKTCEHPFCTQLPASIMAPHLNSKCLRKIPERKAWVTLIKQHQPLVDKIKETGKWPEPFKRKPDQQAVSAITALPSATVVAATVSIPLKAKKPKSKGKRKAPSVSSIDAGVPPVAASIKQLTESDSDVEMNDIGDEDSSSSDFDYNAMELAASSFHYPNYNTDCKNTCEFKYRSTYVQRVCVLNALFNENRMVVPVEINKKPFKALVDPGATASFLHNDAAAKLGLKLEQTPGPSVRMANGTLSSKQITAEKITLLCNGYEIETKVFAMHLDEYDFLVGMDLFNRLGYFIGGSNNPAIGPSARYEEVLIETDMPPAIVAVERPEHELTKDFQNKRENFIKHLQPLLKANAAIDSQSFCTHPLMEVDLAIPPGVTVYQRPHKPFPQAEKANVQTQIDTWLADGVIIPTPGRVSHLNQLTLAARRDLEGHILKTRLCLDPRNLNSHLLNCDNFQLPRIGDILEKASGHKYFSTIDLRQAYHRLPLTEKSQPLTTFDHNGKQYMFARAPFGLKPMTSIFQRGMMKIFEDLDWVAIYVDDIVIFSDSAEEHSRHVQEVLQRLTKYNLIVNPEKCHFFCTEVVLLGFIVNKNGRRINPEKIANVQTWAAPTNAKMVQRYLGLFNYFREYIPLYSTLAAPLDRLRYKKGNFVLNHLQSKCFENLKLLVQRAPALTFPDFAARFYVATDASNLGIGAVLYQLPNGPSDEKNVHYISFMARSLKKHELNYPAYKKELLGIVYALKQFECYLIGRSFTLFTDHRPLTYMHTQSELPTTIANWRETLMKFDFQCVYRPGMLNIIPDALSRAFPDELWKPTDALNPRVDMVTHQSKRIKTATAAISTRSSFRPSTTESNNTNTENPFVISNQLARHVEGLDIDTNAPYIHVMQTEDREYVLPSIHDQASLLKEIHDFGHLNANAMVDAIHRRGYSWPKLKVTCTDWVLKCPQCQRFNIAQKGYHPLKAIHASLPGEHIAIDLAHLPLSEKGNCSILVVVDVCSRFVFLEAIPDKTATTVASRLFKLFCLIGFPKIVQSDNGSEFVNQVINHLMTTLKIDHRLTTPYHPRANGVAERTVRTLKLQLEKSVLSEKPLWDDHLPMVQLQMNNRVASLHSSTPFSLFYGRLFPGLHDFQTSESRPLSAEQMDKRLEYLTALVYPAISEKSKASQQKMIKAFNKKHRMTEFTPGSFVMVKDEEAETALDPKYDGPFKIVRRTSKGTYILRDNMGRLLARNYAPEQLKSVLQSSDISTTETETDHHEVEKILSHRLDTEGGKILYTVKWKGYDESENSEIPYENFDSKKTVDLYYDRIQKNNPHLLATYAKRLETRQLKLNKTMQKQTPSFSIQTRKRSAPQN